uniref:Repressor protein CI n=1 Tax=Siphoviridae sp. ctkyH28 TaxID=2827585 RepID=A0A8S5LM54_9CAUD|nr:MAG TPA: Repressor protein CI [Siphoviridae sp. ctkyH28]
MAQSDSKEIMARNIRKYMDVRGISNQKLCDDLNIKYTTFVDWINAKTYPRIGKIELLSNYFGCEKSDLIEDKLSLADIEKNDLIADVVIRMQTDEDFRRAVEVLYKMSGEKVAGVRQMLEAFGK